MLYAVLFIFYFKMISMNKTRIVLVSETLHDGDRTTKIRKQIMPNLIDRLKNGSEFSKRDQIDQTRSRVTHTRT
jgi:hypothetical protein